MRRRLPLGRALFFLAVLLIALAATLPLRLGIAWLGLDGRGLAARDGAGSVWNGALRDAQLGRVAIGDVQAGLHRLPLLLGRARLSLERDEAGAPFSGAAVATPGSFGVDDVTARLPAAAMFAPLPVATLELDDLTVRFAGTRCAAADGLVRATLAGRAGEMDFAATLAGTARCDGEAAVLRMVGASGMERLDLRLFADGRYRFDLIVRPPDPAAAARLAAAGFEAEQGGYRLRLDGHF